MGDSRRIQFAVPGPSTRINVPGTRVNGPVIIAGGRQRQPAYNSALSDAWNNPSSTSLSSSSQSAVSSTSRSPPKNELRTTCLFCPNFVIIQGGLPKETPEVIARRTKLLKNVCFHLQVNANELPANGTKFQFPFCPSCDKFVKELMEFQETLELIKEKIAKHVSTLERTVADREILGSRPTSAIERQKFVRLYDMILEGYRNKLIRQRERNNSQYCRESNQNQNHSTFNPMRLRQFHGELPSSSSISRNGFETEESNRMQVSVDPLDFGGEVEVVEDVNISSSPDGEEEEQSYQNYFEDETNNDEDDDNEWNLEQNMEANYNERNCTLIISKVQSTATSSSSTATATSSSGGFQSRRRNRARVSTSAAAAKKRKRRANRAPTASAAAAGRNNAEGGEAINLVQVKQEMYVEDEDDEEEEGDATSADVYRVAERKRRLLFEGVEIVKCNGTRRTKNDEFLQCSACPFTLPILKLSRKDAKDGQEMSPYVKIKMHIQNVHTDNPGPLKPRATPQFVCGPCNITFPNLATLRDHNRTHPVPEALPCDICGRPIKGGHFNLQLHKFSHKNDEERRISLANNERGSYPAFLAAKLTSLYNPTKKNSRSGNSSSASRKRNRNRSRNVSTTPRKPSSSNRTTSATIPGSSNGNVVTTIPINTAATRSARAARRRGSAAEVDVDAGIAKPYGCRICNKYFSQRNHLTLHMRYHGYRKGERGQPQSQEEGGEPIPSTSAAALAEQSIGAGIASRRRHAAVSGLTTSPSQPPPPTDVHIIPNDAEGEGLRPPRLSPQETAELAANIESSIEEVCGEMGISLDGIDAGEREVDVEGDGEEGGLVAPVLKREED